MECRSALQDILNIAAALSPPSPSTSTSPEGRDLSQPRIGLGSSPKIFHRLLATGLSKKLSSKLNAIYHDRVSSMQAVVVEQLKVTWLNLCQKSVVNDKLLKARFKVLADILVRQLVDGRNRHVEIAIDCARNYAEETRSQPRPKWNKKLVPIFEWIFDNRFGHYPSLDERHKLAQASGMTYRQVVVWFQNRRARSKKRLAAEAAALQRAENSSETSTSAPSPLDPSFVELMKQDRRIRPKYLIAEHLAALSSPVASGTEAEGVTDIYEEEVPNDGRFLSAREEEEVLLQEEYLSGVRINELDNVNNPPYSFPQQMGEHETLPAPSFSTPEWPRQPLAENESFLPVRNGEVTLLRMELGNLAVSRPPEDEVITTLCEGYSILDLDGASPSLDSAIPSLDTSASADDLVPELEEDDGEDDEDEEGPSSPITSPETTPEPPTVEQVQDEPVPSRPSTPSAERSLSILRRGVGKVRLLRTTRERAELRSKSMAPPPRPRPKKLAVCKNIFNGRPKSIRKSRLPIVRELPPLPEHMQPQPQPQAQVAVIPPQHPLNSAQPDIPTEDRDREGDEDIDEEDGGYDYGEYIEEYDEDEILEDVEGVQYYLDDEELELVNAILEETLKDDSSDLSPDESEVSFSGTSCFESDLDEALIMETVNLSAVEVHEHFQPVRDLGMPDCFKIPFDPVIAESALEETLNDLNITPNWAMPLPDYASLYHDSFSHLVPQDSFDDPCQMVDLVAFSNAFTDNFYAPNATIDLGVSRPTFMEEYQASLPPYSAEPDYPDPEDFLQVSVSEADLIASLPDSSWFDLTFPSPPENPSLQPSVDGSELTNYSDQSFLSSITHAPENDTTLPAFFAKQESEFPEEFGDGSQYLVLDPAYDLTEFEQQVYRFPSFLPPGGIHSGRYSYPEPPPLESYARPLPAECHIFVSHGPTQFFDAPSLRPVILPSPPIIVPAPPPRHSLPKTPEQRSIFPAPHLPLIPSQGSDGTEAPRRNVLIAGLSSLMSMITSAPGYILRGSTPEPPPLRIEDIAPMSWEEPRPPLVLSFEEELGMETRSTWPTLPLLEEILDLF